MKQALYRKYRPTTFDEVYGQDNIVNILKNQIKNNKISHAYIFSGTRGTGKTSTAKIFAKAVNCLNPVDGNPCNECASCIAVQEERTMDIVEMDAASNRRIDDIRQLREQVIYPPTLLKYKVYIIDEAHMITNEGFNALLKIMEEPPKHLIFILATTEIDKIPDTILSRTQRFEFKSIGISDIKSQIDEILKKENISIEDRAVDVIANVASGAMRDALSILDQVISIGKTHITSADVYDLLGVFSDNIKIEYSSLIFGKNIKGLLSLIDDELNKGKDPNNFIKEIVTFFKDLIYIKIGIRENFAGELLDEISLDQLINSVDILLEYEELMKKSDSASLLFRLGSLRLIDYMPRKQLEAKIKNLEERLLFLERNGIRVESKNTNREDFHNHVDNDSIEELFSEYDKENENLEYTENTSKSEEVQDPKLDDSSNGKKIADTKSKVEQENELSRTDNISEERTTKEASGDIERLRQILKEKYPMTNLVMNEVKESKQMLNRIVFFVEEDVIPKTRAMSLLFNNAQNDLNELVGKEYEIKFEIFKEKGENSKYDEKKVEELKKIFPEDKFIVKDKR